MKEIALLGIILLISTSLNAFDENAARAIFESRCSICHPTDWALERRKTRSGWEDTVNRMRKKTAGNVINSSDEKVISDYLFKIRGK